MKNENIKHIGSKLGGIKLIVFDVDGVLVPRGTKIKRSKDGLYLGIKTVAKKQVNQIKKLRELGFEININSGRGLYMLQDMFREVLQHISITYENGSATWYKGKIYQHVNSLESLYELTGKLLAIKDDNILGFEPKEFIITIHCKNRVLKIEKTVSQYYYIYCLWNNEAYDIGIKIFQTKRNGIVQLEMLLKIKKENILVIGDNYNDAEMMRAGGISITADGERVGGDFFVPLSNKLLPADIVMKHIIEYYN